MYFNKTENHEINTLLLLVINYSNQNNVISAQPPGEQLSSQALHIHLGSTN
jgi:hypothetical protein